jgi:signal transduction histidine kinase
MPHGTSEQLQGERGRRRDPLRRVVLPASLPSRVAAAIGTLLFLLALILASSALALRALNHSANDRYAESAIPLQRLVSDLVTQMVNEESGLRGFLITRDETSLGPYHAGRAAVAHDLLEIDRYLPGHPGTRRLVRLAGAQIDAIDRFFEAQIALVRSGRAGAFLARQRVDTGKDLFDSFRQTSRRMLADTERYIASVHSSQTRTYHTVLTALLSLGGLALAVGIWLAFRVPANIRRLLRELGDSERRRQAVLNEMMRAEQGERERLATELHDDTIQVMTAALLTIDRLERTLADAGAEPQREAVHRSRQMLEAAVERTRRLIFEVRPPLLEAHGLPPALRDLAQQAGAEAGFETSVDAEVERYAFIVEDMAYRIVREAVVNARKHSHARHLDITLAEQDGVLRGSVSDDGRGFDLAAALDRSVMRMHVGLDSMIERVRLAGGEVRIDTQPGAGTNVNFEIPTTAGDLSSPVLAAAGARAAVR